MYIKNKRGQSTVEYVLLVTAVLAVIISFVLTKNGMFQQKLFNTLNGTVQGIDTEKDQLTSSHPASQGGGGGPLPYNVPVCPPGVTGPGCP